MAARAIAKVLDKSLFTKKITLLALRIPTSECKTVVSNFKKFLLNKPRISNVEKDTDASKRLILLKEDLKDVPDEIRTKVPNIETVSYEIALDYDYWPADHVLREVLPADVEVPSSFETVGHIAHLNLREQHLPYKHVIGQVILDKNPNIKTVVNKLDSINTTFRTFEMEVLAGVDDFNVEVKESNCTFRFNYSEVYWNSRLQTEHDRLVRTFSASSVICDMFAGVGPFSVPAAKKCAMVYANDLNPQSVKYLNENAKLNKVHQQIRTYNMDARDFVRRLVREEQVKIDHVIMNLPASAVQFLDVFKDLYPAGAPALPAIHCYGFSKAEDPRADIVRQIEQVLGRQVHSPTVYEVRNVAPKKYMFCVSFTLPATDAPIPESSSRDTENSPPNKRRKLNNGEVESSKLKDEKADAR